MPGLILSRPWKGAENARRKCLEWEGAFCYKAVPMKMRMTILVILLLSSLLLFSGSGIAEAEDHFYISFSVVLGGLAAGAGGLYFLFGYEGEVAKAPLLSGNALLNRDGKGFSWDMPELVIKTSDSVVAGPQGIQGYACLFRVRFP